MTAGAMGPQEELLKASKRAQALLEQHLGGTGAAGLAPAVCPSAPVVTRYQS